MSNITYSSEVTKGNQHYQLLKNQIIKSSNDKRDYASLKLSNDLEVLIISDSEAEKSAAALDVFVGSQNDPPELPGLAHFCEHLLFMGNEKYPKENDYSEYLAENGGYSNAFTSYDHTNYYFEVGVNNLEGALDRFAQFFISSLFSPSCTEREIKAVDSENKKNLQSDNWRIHQLQKSQSRPDHPYHSFSTGNIETLLEIPKSKGIDTREELLKFYNKFYSANLMKLVVSGKESLEQLIEWVVPRFSLIENKGISPPTHPGSPFDPKNAATQLYVVPVKDARSLELQFEIPSQLALYESKPANFIAHFIGHEGPGSILSLLKAKGWATELYSSTTTNHVEFAIFEIGVELTPQGLEHTREIMEIIFQYIKLLKEEGVNETLYDELKAIWDVTFRFQEKSDVSNYVSRFAGIMHRPIPPHLVLSSPSTFTKFDKLKIVETLECFKPELLRTTLVSQANSERTDLVKEPWYGTQYAQECIDSLFVKSLGALKANTSLNLPSPNPFIPSNFDLVKTDLSDREHPVLLVKDNSCKLWYHRGSFEVPKASLCLLVRNPYSYSSPRLFVMLELLKDIVAENLTEFGYDAQMAGLNYDLDVQYKGVYIVIHGYNHKLEKLLDEIVKQLKNPTISETTFDMCKEKMVRNLNNAKMNSPVSQAGYFTSYALVEKMWTNDEKAREAPHITREELDLFARSFLTRAHIEALILGNISPEDSVALLNHAQGLFNFTQLHPAELIPRRNMLLPEPKCSYVHQIPVFDKNNLNSAIEFYLDIYSYPDIELRAYTELVVHLISEPAFNQLRTIEQLGYMVFSGPRSLSSRGGIRILIQSERDPIYLESRIENFIELFIKLVDEFTDEEFQSRVQALIENKLKKDENLAQLMRRDWEIISSGFYDFNNISEVVKFLKKVSKARLVKHIQDFMVKDSPHRRKLSLHLKSQKNSEDNNLHLESCGTVVSDLIDWKLSLGLSPAPYQLLVPEFCSVSQPNTGKKANL